MFVCPYGTLAGRWWINEACRGMDHFLYVGEEHICGVGEDRRRHLDQRDVLGA